jgi:hypothetical protein
MYDHWKWKRGVNVEIQQTKVFMFGVPGLMVVLAGALKGRTGTHPVCGAK